MVRKSVFSKNSKFIVAEDKIGKAKTFKFHENGEVTRENSVGNASRFDSPEEAEEALKKWLPFDDFGLKIFKIYKQSSSEKAEWHYGKNSIIERDGNVIKVNELTEEIIALSVDEVDEGEVDLRYAPDWYLHENREEVKRELMKKIGQLIDFHNRCDIGYSSSSGNAAERKKQVCEDCMICRKIEEYNKILEKDSLSKFYKYIIGEERKRFNNFQGNDKNRSEEKRAYELSRLFYDFVPLRLNGFGLRDIAKFYGIGTSSMLLYYDIIADSKYCKVIGRNDRSNKKEVNYGRIHMDIDFV